jgi:predicted nucleotidyltransferase
LNILARVELEIQTALSQAKGQARPHSDIDIAVFSHKFKNKSHYTAQVMLQKYLWGIKADIQPVGYPVYVSSP